MACQPVNITSRSQYGLGASLDEELALAAQRYAAQHDVSMSTLIECALASFMIEQQIPVRLRFCATHGVLMIHNSSGTTVACPVEEDEPSLMFNPATVYPG